MMEKCNMRNRQWRVKVAPDANEIIDKEHFEWVEEYIPELQDNEFLVKTICLAAVPAQRGYLETHKEEFMGNLYSGEVMQGRGVGQIIQSRHPDYQVGKIFVGSLGWQEYSIQKPMSTISIQAVKSNLHKQWSSKIIQNPVKPLSLNLSLIGNTGVTAYFGITDIGKIKRGDNVLVTAAAGGTGSLAGQIAKDKGANLVVGTVGTEKKCNWICNKLGFDAAINYKTDDIEKSLQQHFPKGIDVIFDNVGGDILNTSLSHLALGARIVICGFIATDYKSGDLSGPINYREIVYKRARMEGFVVFDYWNRYAEAEEYLLDLYRSDKIKSTEDVSEGLETMPDCLKSLFTGSNQGQKICRVAPDPL